MLRFGRPPCCENILPDLMRIMSPKL